jgi:arylsulfatase A-like enzyme
VAKPSNLLVVFGDEMRAQAMGCSGNPDVRTPAMDRLADEGCRFERAYSNTPVCTPARGSLLTGLYPLEHGAIINDIPIRSDVTSIAHVLGDSGHRCGYIGKWHLGGVPRSRFIPPGPERLGFDDYWASWNCHHNYFDPKYFLDEPEPVFAEGYEPTVQTDLALDFMKDHQQNHGENPFTLFLSWGPPHDPYEPWPPESDGSYDPDELTLRPNCQDTAEHRKSLAGYYAHVSALDAELDRLLRYLDESGLADNTLVVFLSDHGSMLGSQGFYNKQQPWIESIQVPLIMRLPGLVPSDRTSELLISIMDIAPTLLGVLRLPIPVAMQGRDLSPQVTASAPLPNRTIYIADQSCVDQAIGMGITPWRGIKTTRYTYARNTQGPWVLFDDIRDPYQQDNLIGVPGMANLAERLDDVLLDQMELFDDKLLDVEDAMQEWGLTEAWMARNEHLYSGRNMGGEWPGRA